MDNSSNFIVSLTPQKQDKYSLFLEETKGKILSARIAVARAACKKQIELYLWIGGKIIEHQEKYNWGKSSVEKLSNDLAKEFPDSTFGFSPRNLWNMRSFYLEYKDHPTLQSFTWLTMHF